MSLNLGMRIGPYEVLPLEGSGGMAEVYRAHDTILNREVALKVLPARLAFDKHSLGRLKREAQVLASLNHPNIASIYGYEQSAGVHALVLEMVDGPTLADRLAQGALRPDEALSIARQIVAALEAAHEHGIIHRDLKPANIKLRPDGTVKVLDFGLAKILDPPLAGSDVHAPTVTFAMDAVMGTAAYMSPEQAGGQSVDRRADIWAFGCVLYEMLTGKRPFAGENTAQTIAAVIGAEPDWSRLPAGVSPTLQVFLRRCLRKDPKQRLRDIGDLRLALDGAFEHAADASGGTPRVTRRAKARHLLAWCVGIVVTGAVTGLALWTNIPDRDERAISFFIRPPEGSAFERVTMQPYPALSPDGRYLAFTASFESRPVLWVQAIGDLEARRLPDTEDAAFPFWSPDGQFIAFVARGRIIKIAVSGDRPAQELCNCDAVFGGTWTASGTIVFGARSGLSRVAAEGGEAVHVTRIDESRGEHAHRFPTLLPGSDTRLVYLIRSTREQYRGLYLTSLDAPDLKQRLVPDDSNGAFGAGPDGRHYLFYVRNFTLLAQPFDRARGTLSGEPIVIAQPVVPGEAGRLAPFAVRGRTIVYRRGSAAQNRLVWMDRHGIPGETVGTTRTEYRYPSLSPDGTKLAVAQVDVRLGKPDTWVLDLRRHVSERVTTDPVGAFFPLWVPDGRRIVFASARSGFWDLYAQSADGSGDAELLYHDPEQVGYPTDITDDGRFLLFYNQTALWSLPIRGDRRPSRLLKGIQGRVSPDGRWLAYTSRESAERQVYVTTFPVPGERWRISPVNGEDPQWRRDGQELYFVAGKRTLTAVQVKPTTTFEPGTPRPLFNASFDPRGLQLSSAYAPAADGQRFLVNENVEAEDLVLWVTMNWTPKR
jgi:Tol biopolymer transport system component